MSTDELSHKYMCLRADLDRAYGEPVWNSEHIDSLTNQIADTEFALAASFGPSGYFHAAHIAAFSGHSAGTGTAVARL